MATGNNPLGSFRVINPQSSSGGKDDSMKGDALGAEFAFDGQSYYVGPNNRAVLPNAGQANASAYGPVGFDDTKAPLKHPSSAPADN